jgi:hypothetical protein
MNLTAMREVVTRKVRRPGRSSACVAGMALLFTVLLPAVASAQPVTDPVTGFAREPVHVAAWPGGKKVAVSLRCSLRSSASVRARSTALTW